MVMSYIWTFFLLVSLCFSLFTGSGSTLAAAVMRGAQSGITLAISMAGAICLWSGVGRAMEAAGMTGAISRLFSPVLHRLFPSARKNPSLADALSANICANFLGLGNAATPMGIRAVKHMKQGNTAGDELCRFIVLNTSSIQLIPANVAAIRAGLGCEHPFDILPAVWVTSLCSAGLGICAAVLLGKLWPHD